MHKHHTFILKKETGCVAIDNSEVSVHYILLLTDWLRNYNASGNYGYLSEVPIHLFSLENPVFMLTNAASPQRLDDSDDHIDVINVKIKCLRVIQASSCLL